MRLDLPVDVVERRKLVDLVGQRFRRSSKEMQPWMEKWERFYKIYMSIVDAVDDADEINTVLPYAFGIVQDCVGRAVEPLFRLKPPVKIRPRKPQHKVAAENFKVAATSYFSSATYQIDYTASVTEETITGNRWEKDSWLNRRTRGIVLKKVERTGIMHQMQSLMGNIIPLQASEFTYPAWEEVVEEIPVQVGYHTSFPSVFDVWPEPGKKRVKDMHWLIEEDREVALEDLRQEKITLPDGSVIPAFDLSEIEADFRGRTPGAIKAVRVWAGESDYGEDVRRLQSSNRETSDAEQDLDTVWLCRMYEPDRIVTVANGKYLIQVIRNPWHRRPRIPFRICTYTLDPQHLFGMGAVEPVEDLLHELKDIHTLSMRNWVRIINGMLAYREDRIPHPEDLTPKPGWRVRVVGGGNIHEAIAAIPQQDISNSMLTMESNAKGLIERVLSVVDYSPGVKGTKPQHETLGGLMEIQQSLGIRFALIQRNHLAVYQDQLESMEAFFSQFQFDKVAYHAQQSDGTTIIQELSLEDYYTEGVGFDYITEIDPSFGDDVVLRNQLMVAFDLALKYETWRAQFGLQSDERVYMPEIMRKLLNSFGWSDTSSVLKRLDNVLDPGREFEMMMQGMPAVVQEGEDKLAHLVEHTIQRMSPKLAELVKSGQAKPSAVMMLDEHLAMTKTAIVNVLSDPGGAARAKLQQMLTAMPMGKENAEIAA